VWGALVEASHNPFVRARVEMAVTILAARPRQHDASVHGGMRSGLNRGQISPDFVSVKSETEVSAHLRRVGGRDSVERVVAASVPVATQLSHPLTPAHTRSHPLTPTHTRSHPLTPAHTRSHSPVLCAPLLCITPAVEALQVVHQRLLLALWDVLRDLEAQGPRRWRSQQWDGQVGVRDEPMAQIEDIGHAVVRLHVCAGRSHRAGVAAEARPELENWLVQWGLWGSRVTGAQERRWERALGRARCELAWSAKNRDSAAAKKRSRKYVVVTCSCQAPVEENFGLWLMLFAQGNASSPLMHMLT
jgi:hypothetical protein